MICLATQILLVIMLNNLYEVLIYFQIVFYSDENQTGNDHEVEKNIEEILHFGHESMLKVWKVNTVSS